MKEILKDVVLPYLIFAAILYGVPALLMLVDQAIR